MDILVLLDECDDTDRASRVEPSGRPTGARPLAYVHSAPDATAGTRVFGSRARVGGREVVTLCEPADASRLAVALAAAVAAAVEGRSASRDQLVAIRYLGVWDGLGATGDTAWRDRASGQMRSQNVVIDAATIEATARQLLVECGRVIRQTAADLCAPDWPEGIRRALTITIPAPGDAMRGAGVAAMSGDDLLASLREADGHDGYYAYDDAD